MESPPRHREHGTRTGLVIPSIGSPTLGRCLESVEALDPGPDRAVVVLSGGASSPEAAGARQVVTHDGRLGFAAAVNTGIRTLGNGLAWIAVVNDDVVLPVDWLDRLRSALMSTPGLAAVQGTLTNHDGSAVDGRGVAFDRYGLPIQVDRGRAMAAETDDVRPILSVSGTAALFRSEALEAVSSGRARPFDPGFGSYHEDVDLGLRLRRMDLECAWVGGAPAHHVGSASGARLRWRHPWWVLANRWRVVSSNLTASALVTALPRLIRGEVRAVSTLARGNPRAPVVAAAVAAAWPALIWSGWRRSTPGPRLTALPEAP